MRGNLRLAERLAGNWLRLKVFGEQRLPRPMVLSYFVTFRCNLFCSYCDYTDPAFHSRYPELSTSDAIRVLEISRAGVPALAVSGGEPLLREDIVELLRAARRLRYDPIMLFTNSLLLPERTEVLDYVDILQFSLDTINESGRMKDHRGVAGTVMRNVRRFARLQRGKGFRLTVNCVVSGDRIGDAKEVLEFASENGVGFTLAPELKGGQPVPALVGSDQYEALLGDIIAAKQQGRAVLDTFVCLSHVRHFRPFLCRPWLTPRVYPNGELLYPCPQLPLSTHNVLQEGTWRRLEGTIRRDHGARVDCGGCFLPCYLEASTLLSDPVGAVKELRRL
jgi:MoaA/NifB/PqqE/SkfB family radical SAM enzyme